MRQFVATRDELLRARAAAGWIREGHGDLRVGHVCLEPGGVVQIFDCVEFNRDLRCADVASDLAFLLMDLTRLGASEVATSLLARYREAGLDLPDELLRLYSAHRALVRAKIAGLELPGSGREEAARLMAEATDYLDLASGAALTVQPVLVAMTGLSGTGKSTVARRLARALGARLFASDVVRKELAGIEGPARPLGVRESTVQSGLEQPMTGSLHWPKQVSAPARPSFSTPPSLLQSSGRVRQCRRLGPTFNSCWWRPSATRKKLLHAWLLGQCRATHPRMRR